MAKYFKFKELLTTDTGLPNIPDWEQVDNLRYLANELDMIREAFGRAIRVTSGYRSPAVNKAVGGSSTSMHLKGLAADIKPWDGTSAQALYDLVCKRDGVLFAHVDQIIRYVTATGFVRWVHVGYAESGQAPRHQCLEKVVK